MGRGYFYRGQSEQFVFYRTPKALFTEPEYEKLTIPAKALYGILLDRESLSDKSGWFDDKGRIFVYMTNKSICKALNISDKTATKLLVELEEIDLIQRVRQGQGKPTRIYVKNFIVVCGSYSKKYEKHTQGSMSDIPLEVCKSSSNNTEINNTDNSNNNPILSGNIVDNDKDMDERKAYREYLIEQLSMEILFERYPFERETLEAIMDMMLDVICSKRKTIRIAGDDKPVNVVKSQFLKLNSTHIEYVMDCMKNNPVKVRNIKQYLLAAIYNAPLTINSYYQAMVNNDMAEGRI